MEKSESLNKMQRGPKPLNTSQRITVWAGLIGATIGCSAWMLVMAALGNDWMAFIEALIIDVIMVFLFARLSFRHPTRRFPLLAGLIAVITAHSLAMYWWRFSIWRAGAAIPEAELLREKEIVTLTIVAMIAIVMAQFVLFYWLQQHGRKNREKMLRNKQ